MRKLLAIALVLLAGCAGDVAGPAGGTYTLFSVNYAGLPYTLSEDAPYATLFSGTLAIDGREWSQTLIYGGRPAGLITAIRAGRILADAPGRYRFTSPSGTLDVAGGGDELEFESDGAVYVYRRSR